jgi:hypothetical protein
LTLLKLVALALTALILVPSGAHLFELPGKIGLDRDAYFAVQAVYAGWAWFSVPIFGAIIANLALSAVEWRRGKSSASYALVASSLIIVSLVVFFTWVFPGNQATANWTQMPAHWQDLRRSWEYGHAANALILFAALLANGRALIGCRP